jgi:hypothetical protein
MQAEMRQHGTLRDNMELHRISDAHTFELRLQAFFL